MLPPQHFMSPALSKAQLAESEVRNSFLAAAVGARASRSATTSAFRARRACVSRVDDRTARACRSGLGSHETKPSLGRSRADAAVSRAATGTDDDAGRVGVRRMLSNGRGVGTCARACLWSTVSPRRTHMRCKIKIFRSLQYDKLVIFFYASCRVINAQNQGRSNEPDA